MPTGRGTSHSALHFAFVARQPQCVSPTPNPVRMTWSPAFHFTWRLSSTTPTPSMPATMGHRRTTGEASVIASPSL